MERDGLISRTPHPQDRRATAITLTAKARNHLDRIYSLAAQIGADAMENIPAERRRQLMSDLETISAGLGTPTDTTDTTQPRP